ncbi:TetR/AcrR family transcriptional regulator [Nocardioides marmoraquaticus]
MVQDQRRYHHGSLKQTLLEEGRRLLVEEGEGAVSLRELARRAGVSHGAPRRHFADREALLDALAAQGFDELSAQLLEARSPGDIEQRLANYARAHVAFAAQNGPLMRLMFARPGRLARPESAASVSAARFAGIGAAMFEPEEDGRFDSLPWVLTATLEGIGGLLTSGRLPLEHVDDVTAHAVRMLLPAVRGRARTT